MEDNAIVIDNKEQEGTDDDALRFASHDNRVFGGILHRAVSKCLSLEMSVPPHTTAKDRHVLETGPRNVS